MDSPQISENMHVASIVDDANAPMSLEKKIVIVAGVLVAIVIVSLVGSLHSDSSSFKTFDTLDSSAVKQQQQTGEVAGATDQQIFGPPAGDSSASPTEMPPKNTHPTATPEPTKVENKSSETPTASPQPTSTPEPTQAPTVTPEAIQAPTSTPTAAP